MAKKAAAKKSKSKKADKDEVVEPGVNTPDPALVRLAEANAKVLGAMKPDADRQEDLVEARRLSQILKIEGPDAFRHKIDFMVTQEEEDAMREWLTDFRLKGGGDPRKKAAAGKTVSKDEAARAKKSAALAEKTAKSAKKAEPKKVEVVVK